MHFILNYFVLYKEIPVFYLQKFPADQGPFFIIKAGFFSA